MSKVKYGLKNVHYALATLATDGSATYGTPVAIPGAVSLSMDPQGEKVEFYADNIAYFVSEPNSGYEGTLEIALVPDSFKKDILKYAEDTSHVLVEDANAASAHFALMFEFDGDVNATRHVFYNCTASRPAVGSNTKGESVEVQTEQLSVRATSVLNTAVNKELVKASTKSDTVTTVYSGFFGAVYQPTTLTT